VGIGGSSGSGGIGGSAVSDSLKMTVGGALGNRPLGSLPGATAGASLIAHAGSPGDAPKLQHPTLEEDTGGVLQTVAAGRTGGAGGEVLVRICHGAISCRGGGGGGAANPWLPGGGGGGGMEFGAPCACPGSRLREPTPCAVTLLPRREARRRHGASSTPDCDQSSGGLAGGELAFHIACRSPLASHAHAWSQGMATNPHNPHGQTRKGANGK